MTVEFITNLKGWFKTVYADKWENAIPEWAVVSQLIPFGEQQRLGNTYNFPVLLRRSHGDSWTGTTGAAVTLNDAVSLITQEASVGGSGYVLQEDVSYETLSRAASGSKASFDDTMVVVMESMRGTADFKREAMLLYGNSSTNSPWGNGLGTTTTAVGAGAGPLTFTFTAATWAPGIWVQAEGMYVDMYNGTTKQNDGAGGRPNTLQITSVDVANKTVQLTLDTGTVEISSGDYLLPRGAYGKWADGIFSILSNAGTQFGIAGATYSQWLAQSYSFGSQKLSFGKILKSVSKAVGKGLMDNVVVLCNHEGFTDVATDMAALRRFADASGQKDVQFGTRSVTFFGPNGGTVELRPHPMIMEGYAPIIVPSQWKRRGSTDVTFKLPGLEGGKSEAAMWMALEAKQAVRFRGYFDQCLICTKPSSQVLGTTIVNNT